ncbi:MAG: hypothetical protein QHH75_01655 [Bacillota bacterium]|nr:hypothetical protein [Bacillota bacterium]
MGPLTTVLNRRRLGYPQIHHHPKKEFLLNWRIKYFVKSRPKPAPWPDALTLHGVGDKYRVTAIFLKSELQGAGLHKNTAWGKQGHEGPFLPEGRLGFCGPFSFLLRESERGNWE